jgi:hypothetical protein
MDQEQIKAKIAEYEAELKRQEVLVYRLQGAIAGLKDLLEPVAPEKPEAA